MIASWLATESVISADLENVIEGDHFEKALNLSHYMTNILIKLSLKWWHCGWLANKIMYQLTLKM